MGREWRLEKHLLCLLLAFSCLVPRRPTAQSLAPERPHCFFQLSHKHAARLLPRPRQVSIVPRGSAALGFAQYLPNENVLMTTEQVGGRAGLLVG